MCRNSHIKKVKEITIINILNLRRMMSMAGRMLSILKSRRDSLIDRWMDNNPTEKAKLLVRLMDIDDDIDKEIKEEKRQKVRKYN